MSNQCGSIMQSTASTNAFVLPTSLLAWSRVLFDANGGQECEGGRDERGMVVMLGKEFDTSRILPNEIFSFCLPLDGLPLWWMIYAPERDLDINV